MNCFEWENEVQCTGPSEAGGDLQSSVQSCTTVDYTFTTFLRRSMTWFWVSNSGSHSQEVQSHPSRSNHSRAGEVFWLQPERHYSYPKVYWRAWKVAHQDGPVRLKAWIYQHTILLRDSWPLFMYAVPITTVESLERKISSFLRGLVHAGGYSPNLHALGKSETPYCLLCSARGSLELPLSSLPKAVVTIAVAMSRYSKMLLSLSHEHHQTSLSSKEDKIPLSRLEKDPRQVHRQRQASSTKLPWQLHVDLGKQVPPARSNNISLVRRDHHLWVFKTPDHAGIHSALRRVDWASERKFAKYQELVEECRGRAWRTLYEPITVGCRGFGGRSFSKVAGPPRRGPLSLQMKLQRNPHSWKK